MIHNFKIVFHSVLVWDSLSPKALCLLIEKALPFTFKVTVMVSIHPTPVSPVTKLIPSFSPSPVEALHVQQMPTPRLLGGFFRVCPFSYHFIRKMSLEFLFVYTNQREVKHQWPQAHGLLKEMFVLSRSAAVINYSEPNLGIVVL